MGICTSCEITSIPTAKLILEDGKLVEYSYPIKVSNVLQKINNEDCFICNSDEMEFNDQLSAIDDNQELQIGHLYFALPLIKLRYPLQPEEMAALAVKANSALMKSGYGGGAGGNRKQVSPVTFTTTERKIRPEKKVVDNALVVEKRRRGGRGRNFTSVLGAIPE